jgi:hypothetical protein
MLALSALDDKWVVIQSAVDYFWSGWPLQCYWLVGNASLKYSSLSLRLASLSLFYFRETVIAESDIACYVFAYVPPCMNFLYK